MRTAAKFGLVAGGYLAALVLAWLATLAYIAVTEGQDRQTYGAMFAFGDSVLFLGVFAVASLPATGLWLYFLRGSAWFWNTLSLLAIAAAGLSLFLLAGELARSSQFLLMVAPLWFLSSPLFICGFGLAFLFAPSRRPRLALGWSTAIQGGAVAAIVLLAWHCHDRMC